MAVADCQCRVESHVRSGGGLSISNCAVRDLSVPVWVSAGRTTTGLAGVVRQPRRSRRGKITNPTAEMMTALAARTVASPPSIP